MPRVARRPARISRPDRQARRQRSVRDRARRRRRRCRCARRRCRPRAEGPRRRRFLRAGVTMRLLVTRAGARRRAHRRRLARARPRGDGWRRCCASSRSIAQLRGRAYGAVVMTSANAARAVASHPRLRRSSHCRCSRSAATPPRRRAPPAFATCIRADGDEADLAALVRTRCGDAARRSSISPARIAPAISTLAALRRAGRDRGGLSRGRGRALSAAGRGGAGAASSTACCIFPAAAREAYLDCAARRRHSPQRAAHRCIIVCPAQVAEPLAAAGAAPSDRAAPRRGGLDRSRRRRLEWLVDCRGLDPAMPLHLPA